MVGTNDLSKGGQYYGIEKLVRHEKFNQPKGTYANDIALIRLNEAIEFNERIQPIKLSSEKLPDGTTLELTGWGAKWFIEVSAMIFHIHQGINF